MENLVSSEFVSLVRLTEKFVSCSTQITGRHCPNLRSALLTQVGHSSPLHVGSLIQVVPFHTAR